MLLALQGRVLLPRQRAIRNGRVAGWLVLELQSMTLLKPGKPRRQECVEIGCSDAAGTRWGPHWCGAHCQERRERISRQLEELEVRLAYKAASREWSS